jgi:hypothetical protein
MKDVLSKIKCAIQGLTLNGVLHAVYVVFREGEQAVNSVEFKDNDLVIVDKGKDSYPIAIEVIFSKGIAKDELKSVRVEQGQQDSFRNYILSGAI